MPITTHAAKPRSTPSRNGSVSGAAGGGWRITFIGLLYLGVVLMMGLAALRDANLLFLLFGISVGILLFNAIYPVRVLKHIQVQRIAPASVVVGQSFTMIYNISQPRGWLRARSLIVGETPTAESASLRLPRAYVGVLHGRGENRIELVGELARRGRIRLTGIRVQCRFPLGLFSYALDIAAPAEFLVYPAIDRPRRDLWRDHGSGDPASRRSTTRAGLEEFYSLREYREGDSPRWVHWRRSAHLGHLLVREPPPGRTRCLIVVVDPWPQVSPSSTRPHGAANRLGTLIAKGWQQAQGINILPFDAAPDSARGTDVSVERCISMAAGAVCAALEKGHRVGMIARSAAPMIINPSRGRIHRERLLQALAMMQGPPAEPLESMVSRFRWAGGFNGRCVLCVTRIHASHEQVKRYLATRTEAVLCLNATGGAVESSPAAARQRGVPA